MAARKKTTRKSTRKAKGSRRKPRSPRATRSRKTAPRGSKDPGGRPAIDWTEDVCASIAEMAEAGNTVQDMARILKVSKSSLEEAIADEGLPVRDAYHGGGAKLNNELRRAQVKFAKRGSAQLLIWLGKQRLKQRDVKAVEITGEDGGAVKFTGNLAPVLQRKLGEFLRSRGKK